MSGCSADEKSLLDNAFGKLTNISQIGTVEYTISKLIIVDSNAFYKIGERKIIFSCEATMKAGIDLSTFTKEDVVLDKKNKIINVTLPAPTVLAFNMPADKIKLEYSKVSGLRSEFTVAERNNLLVQGEKEILADAGNLGIYDDAKENATVFFQSLLGMAGYEDVVVNFKEPVEENKKSKK